MNNYIILYLKDTYMCYSYANIYKMIYKIYFPLIFIILVIACSALGIEPILQGPICIRNKLSLAK